VTLLHQAMSDQEGQIHHRNVSSDLVQISHIDDVIGDTKTDITETPLWQTLE